MKKAREVLGNAGEEDIKASLDGLSKTYARMPIKGRQSLTGLTQRTNKLRKLRESTSTYR